MPQKPELNAIEIEQIKEQVRNEIKEELRQQMRQELQISDKKPPKQVQSSFMQYKFPKTYEEEKKP